MALAHAAVFGTKIWNWFSTTSQGSQAPETRSGELRSSPYDEITRDPGCRSSASVSAKEMAKELKKTVKTQHSFATSCAHLARLLADEDGLCAYENQDNLQAQKKVQKPETTLIHDTPLLSFRHFAIYCLR
ncbi:predicted protein [Histoplasma capsulatum var. duboisii H88]|uniref:Predicted protein n=2 Tax=Ajellomyces capsulatus TaxID=5037 RepID=F0UTZ3_AJEC8|nr:predicted protein [Histoplasma capsulatum H143]EGC49370.1 predicted protein [Histoplasma capsulatum var. duboisii H88]